MSVGTYTPGAYQTSASGTSLSYTNLTASAAAVNPALILCATFSAAVSSVTAVWDSGGTNQSMYQIGSVNQSGGAPVQYLFGLRNPVPGNKTLLISWTGTAVCNAACNQLAGVYQLSDTVAFTNWLTAGGTGSSATVSSTAAYTTTGQQSLIYCGCLCGSNITGVNNATWFTANAFSGSLCAGGTYGAPTGSPWGSTVTFTGSTTYGIQAVEIAPAPIIINDRPLMLGKNAIPRAGAPLNMMGTRLFPFALPITAAPPPAVGSTLPMMGVG